MMVINLKDLLNLTVGSSDIVKVAGTVAVDDNAFTDHLASVEAQVKCIREAKGIELNISASVKAGIVCDRCQETFNYLLETEISTNLSLTQIHHLNKGVFDLSDGILEAIYLNLPIRKVCNTDCRGLCPNCGLNLNQKTCNCPKKSSIKRNLIVKKGK